jgi:PIN domain nuclease of toxin-antitoxin system
VTQLDAYALVAWLAGEPCAPEVRPLVRAGTSIASVNLAEVVDQMARVYDADVGVDVEALAATLVDVIPLDLDLAIAAGELRGRHHDPQTADLSLPDCIAIATARDQGVPLATSDPLLAQLMVAEGGEVVALPDSQGRRPE